MANNASANAAKSTSAGAERQSHSTAGAASVEIAGFPQALYLRRKLSDDASDVLIHTIRGAGYRIGGCAMPAISAE